MSRPQGGGPSLNQLLTKGPDCFINNLAAVLIRFRNGQVIAKGDVAKMFYAVKLKIEDWYIQCFLSRGMDNTQEPDVYQVIVNNMGVKPAGSIAMVALQKSAEKFSLEYPLMSNQIKTNSYVDDLGLVELNHLNLTDRMIEVNIILEDAGMEVKNWIVSGSSQTSV